MIDIDKIIETGGKVIDLYQASGLKPNEIIISLNRLLDTAKISSGDTEEIIATKYNMIDAIINGNSDAALILQRVNKRLVEELERNGKDTFTMKDIRRIRRDIYEGKE